MKINLCNLQIHGQKPRSIESNIHVKLAGFNCLLWTYLCILTDVMLFILLLQNLFIMCHDLCFKSMGSCSKHIFLFLFHSLNLTNGPFYMPFASHEASLYHFLCIVVNSEQLPCTFDVLFIFILSPLGRYHQSCFNYQSMCAMNVKKLPCKKTLFVNISFHLLPNRGPKSNTFYVFQHDTLDKQSHRIKCTSHCIQHIS